MNREAEQHCAKAKDYLAKGDQFYRKAKPEIHAAIAAGASQREVARYLARGRTWVQDVIAWSGEGTLYGSDTGRRQNDQAKQILREAPMEQVEQIIGQLPAERQQQIAAAAGNRYAQARQEHVERERDLSPAQRKERDAVVESVHQQTAEMMAGFDALAVANHLDQATDVLKAMIARNTMNAHAAGHIDRALASFLDEYRVAQAMIGQELAS